MNTALVQAKEPARLAPTAPETARGSQRRSVAAGSDADGAARAQRSLVASGRRR